MAVPTSHSSPPMDVPSSAPTRIRPGLGGVVSSRAKRYSGAVRAGPSQRAPRSVSCQARG